MHDKGAGIRRGRERETAESAEHCGMRDTITWEKGEGKERVTTYKVLRFRPLVLLVVVVVVVVVVIK